MAVPRSCRWPTVSACCWHCRACGRAPKSCRWVRATRKRATRDARHAIGYQGGMDPKPLILLAAGGTGGHLFPAEALGVELIKRGFAVRLVTDSRALRYSGLFSKDMI